ncbi:MAG: methylmalonyl-CoA mutase family protein [Desulfatiglandales bacterium]|nr:methylmalonyl-CoA mutase family protein [Desulfatiglandales bacterium]
MWTTSRLDFPFFQFSHGFFEEVAKFRATRRMWAKIMKERFKAKDPRSWWLRLHPLTAGCSLTTQRPYNNTVRTSLEALSAVLGGAHSPCIPTPLMKFWVYPPKKLRLSP